MKGSRKGFVKGSMRMDFVGLDGFIRQGIGIRIQSLRFGVSALAIAAFS